MGIAGTAQRNTYCNCLYDFWTTFETVDWPWTDQCTDLKGDSSLHGVCFGESDEYASWCKQKLLLFALDATRHSVGFLMCRSFSRTIKSLTHVARDKYRCCNFGSFMLLSGCCMKHDISVAVGIYHPRIGYQNHLCVCVCMCVCVASVDFWCYNRYLSILRWTVQ